MTRYLIVAAVLAAGCEQLKTPQRIHDLEGRVDELTSEVATLKGKPLGKPVAPAHAGAEPAGAGSAGKGSAEGSAAGAGSAEGAGSGSAAETAAAGSAKATTEAATEKPADKPADKPEDKPADKGDDKAAATEKPDEAKPGAGSAEPPLDPDSQEARLARLRALVAKTTGETDAAGKPRWSYDGASGPAKWASLSPAWAGCGGKAQSPIDIEPRAGSATAIEFHYKSTAATVVDDGHQLVVKLAPGNSISIDGHSYALTELRFHMPSEHTIAGEHYPFEVQLAHQDTAGKLAMISVLYDTGAESKPLAAVWPKWPHKVGAEDKLHKPLDPATLLPETRTVFRYAGSLTAPPCSEGVLWNVMRRTLSDSKGHLDAFSHHYSHNARDVQARNDRQIQ